MGVPSPRFCNCIAVLRMFSEPSSLSWTVYHGATMSYFAVEVLAGVIVARAEIFLLVCFIYQTLKDLLMLV